MFVCLPSGCVCTRAGVARRWNGASAQPLQRVRTACSAAGHTLHHHPCSLQPPTPPHPPPHPTRKQPKAELTLQLVSIDLKRLEAGKGPA